MSAAPNNLQLQVFIFICTVLGDVLFFLPKDIDNVKLTCFLTIYTMESVFDLPTRPNQLQSASEGVANAHYRQVSASKSVSGAQFSHGSQQFRFDTSGNTWFLPSMSYFRLRCTLTQSRSNNGPHYPPLSRADLAPNMGLASNLFKSVEVQLNGHTVERVAQNLPQIDALKTRTSYSRGWLDNIGRTTNFWDENFDARRAAVAVDGYDVHRAAHTPTYGPKLTQEQAGFGAGAKLRYNAASYIL